LLTREALTRHSQLPSLTGLHVQLSQVMLQAVMQTQSLVTSQQTLLAANLDSYCSSDSSDSSPPS